jgi:hypothetical protein
MTISAYCETSMKERIYGSHELAPTSWQLEGARGSGRRRSARHTNVSACVLITMAALTLTYQTSAVGTSSDNWKADTTLTVTSPPAPPSFAPTLKSAYCKDHDPHAWADGCPI